jgi:hypothetical protein
VATELLDEPVGVEPERQRHRAHVAATEDAARQLRVLLALEELQLARRNLRRVGECRERDALGLPRLAQLPSHSHPHLREA